MFYHCGANIIRIFQSDCTSCLIYMSIILLFSWLFRLILLDCAQLDLHNDFLLRYHLNLWSIRHVNIASSWFVLFVILWPLARSLRGEERRLGAAFCLFMLMVITGDRRGHSTVHPPAESLKLMCV